LRNIAQASERAMKIYMLLMLIGAIVGFSYLPVRRSANPAPQPPSDSLPANA